MPVHDARITQLAKYWSSHQVFDETTRNEVKSLIESGNEKELTERFYRDLEFGTGGLRGILGAGSNRMNIYNVRKATAALALYLRSVYGEQHELKVGLACDSRRYSREFTQAAAEVLAGYGIKALVTKELRPTPMLSFLVRHFDCQGGICITASHNPPEYNGYKVYWRTGGQLVPPHDEAIIARYAAITDYSEIKHVAYRQGIEQGLIREVASDLDEAYFAKILELASSQKPRSKIKIVYTPLHGAGGFPVVEALRRFGFADVHMVPEQAKPDGNFPTVKYPNPEEAAAMNMARDLARKIGADLVLATDPDVDRIGMEIRVGNDYFRPNGNQIGCLLTEYVLRTMQAQKRMPKSPLVVKTIVTTDLQVDIAKKYGAACEETLTGFKWICDLIESYGEGRRTPQREFVCGGEESYGFLAGNFVRDKDAVLACCLAAEMVADLADRGLTVVDSLDAMYTEHGIYAESLYTLTLPGKDGAEAIEAMMARLRKDPPRAIDGIGVALLRDFERSAAFSDQGQGWQRAAELDFPKSNVLQFVLADGTKVSVRPSGTEPKIKFYVSVREPKGQGKTGPELAALKQSCQARVQRIEEIFVNLAR